MEARTVGYLLENAHGRDLDKTAPAANFGESVLSPAIARKMNNRFARLPNRPP
jgi:hypothetical protein